MSDHADITIWRENLSAFGRWQQLFGQAHGIFIDQSASQAIVTAGSLGMLTYPTDPKPSFLATKFGGDWGGLWGAPPQWGDLSPKAQTPPPVAIVPYLYLVPDTATPQNATAMAGGLTNDGYPAIILDVEMEWIGHEPALRTIVQTLVGAGILVVISGFAWFVGWPDKGAAFGKALDDLDVLYSPQAYLGAGWDWRATGQPSFYQACIAELGRVVPSLTKIFTFDAAAIDAGAAQEDQGLAGNMYWYQTTLSQARWRLLHLTPSSQVAVIGGTAEINTDLPAMDAAVGELNSAWAKLRAIL